MTTAALDATVLDELVAAAVAAPSFHRTRPWRFRLDPGTATIHVRAAAEREPRRHDPTGRALHLSVGAALLNLRVAAERFGWAPVVRLLPRPADPGLLATVRLAAAPAVPPKRQRHDLYDALWRRRGSRLPPSGTAIAPERLAEIARGAAAEGVELIFPPPHEAARILRLAAEAEAMATGRGHGAEHRGPVRETPGDGPGALSPARDDEALDDEARDALGFQAERDRGPTPAEEHAVPAVLCTAHDARADWLRAGQGLEHALLVATALDVPASLSGRVTERPELRRALRDPSRGGGHAQLLIRFGHGGPAPGASRRELRDKLREYAEPT